MADPVLFVSADQVALRMQVNTELDGVVDTLNSAILGAQLHVEAVLKTQLLEQSHDVVFFADSDAYSGIQPGGRFRLELPCYFIRQDMPLIITYGSRWTIPEANPIDLSLIKVDYEHGQIYVDAEEYGDKYIRVQCSTGFKAATAETAQETIPEWLAEGILAYVGVVMDVSQTTNRNAEAQGQYENAGKHSIEVIGPHIRKRGFVFRPIG